MKKLSLLIITILCVVLFACSMVACTQSTPDNGGGGNTEQGGSQGGAQNPTTTYYKVTFKQEGASDVVITVESGKGVAQADIPVLIEKDGYTVAWEQVDLSNITADVTVNAVYTPIPVTKYKITLDYLGLKENEQITVEKGEIPTLPKTAEVKGKVWEITWQFADGTNYKSEEYNYDKDITLIAIFSYWS